MSVEQSRESLLEREKRELFAKASSELAKDFQVRRTGYSADESKAQAAVILESRWRTAQGQYRSILGSMSIPPYEEEVDFRQQVNAQRMQELWDELEKLFMTDNLKGNGRPEEPRMSEATAKELVILLTKVNKYR